MKGGLSTQIIIHFPNCAHLTTKCELHKYFIYFIYFVHLNIILYFIDI